MSKVYELKSDTENFSHFLEMYDSIDTMFVRKDRNWDNIDMSTYEPVVLKLHRSDTGKKNFKMDCAQSSIGMIVFSEKAVIALKSILDETGQIFPIITDSKRKKFFGFYPNKNSYDETIVDMKNSEYIDSVHERHFTKIALNKSYPKEEYIFVIKNCVHSAFVTDKFKDLVEFHGLKGFGFSSNNLVKVVD